MKLKKWVRVVREIIDKDKEYLNNLKVNDWIKYLGKKKKL